MYWYQLHHFPILPGTGSYYVDKKQMRKGTAVRPFFVAKLLQKTAACNKGTWKGHKVLLQPSIPETFGGYPPRKDYIQAQLNVFITDQALPPGSILMAILSLKDPISSGFFFICSHISRFFELQGSPKGAYWSHSFTKYLLSFLKNQALTEALK